MKERPMELYASLLSPVWWASVLVSAVLLGVLSSMFLRWQARNRERIAPGNGAESTHCQRTVLRYRLWVVNLLVLANVGMLAGLSAANLRAPVLYGPVGLAFILLCLVSLALSVLVYLASRNGAPRS